MKNDLAKVLITQEEIQRRVTEMGAEIARDYANKEPILVCILKGASIFYADLCRAIPIPMNMDFMAVSSYGNRTKSSGEVEIRKDLSGPIDGRHVIIVEDIGIPALPSVISPACFPTAAQRPCAFARCLTSRSAARRASRSRRITLALPLGTSLWSAMGWIMQKNTGICLISASLSRKFTKITEICFEKAVSC